MKNFTHSRNTYKVILTSLLLTGSAFVFAQRPERQGNGGGSENRQRDFQQQRQERQDRSSQMGNAQRGAAAQGSWGNRQRETPQAAPVQRAPDVQPQGSWGNRQRNYPQAQPTAPAQSQGSWGNNGNRQRQAQPATPDPQSQGSWGNNGNRQRGYSQSQPANRFPDAQSQGSYGNNGNRQRGYSGQSNRVPDDRAQGSYGNRQGNNQQRQGSYSNRQWDQQRQQQAQVYNNRRSNNGNVYGRTSPVYRQGNGNYSKGGYYGSVYSRPRYTRPPVIWQNRRFYSVYDYAYHPYQPRIYRQTYHPLGYFLLQLGAAAIDIVLDNRRYRYDDGVYYEPYDNGYRVVQAPAGADINQLPNGFSTIELDGELFYYYAGTFYVQGQDGGYEVIDAPPGAVVYDLPEGATEFRVGNITYLQYNNAVFQPIVLDGRNAYEVVTIDEEE